MAESGAAQANVYRSKREELKLSREKAAQLLEGMSADRLERIEKPGAVPHPDEVLLMAEKYKEPSLCNHYCSQQCPIGQRYVPEVKMKDLAQIVLATVSSLNALEEKKNRLIDIAADGGIQEDQLDEFEDIQGELERLSITVEALQLWMETAKAAAQQ